MIRKSLVLTVALLAWAAGPAQAELRIDRFDGTLSFSGSVANSANAGPDTCTDQTCRSFDVTLALPGEDWAKEGGALVSLRWPEDNLDIGYDLDLYVYGPDGELAAKSNQVIYSTAEGAWIPNPQNGTYRVVVAPRDLVGSTTFDVYVDLLRGFVSTGTNTNVTDDPAGYAPISPDRVFLGRRPERAEPVLPDLVPRKAKDFHLETTVGGGFYLSPDRGLRHQPSCYAQETLGLDSDSPGEQENTPLRCLRFDQAVDNHGPGPFEIRVYQDELGAFHGPYQAVYDTDARYTLNTAGVAVFSLAHGHMHFQGFDDTGLFEIAPDGSPGRRVATMVDKGRCAADTTNIFFGEAENWPSHYSVPGTCDQHGNRDPEDPLYPEWSYFRSGVSPGWGDEYPWFIPDAYIDITNVSDGRYLVVNRVNVDGAVRETDPTNNTSIACVEFHGTNVNSCPVPGEGGSGRPPEAATMPSDPAALRPGAYTPLGLSELLALDHPWLR